MRRWTKSMKRVAMLWMSVMLASWSAAPAEAVAANSVELEALGAIGGPSHAVSIEGSLAYLATGSQIEVVELSLPTGPARVGMATILPGSYSASIRDMEIEDRHLFAISDSGLLRVFDLTLPRGPREVASLGLPEGGFDIDVQDGLAIVGGHATSSLVDLSDPARPSILADFGRPASGLALDDGRAVLVGPDLALFDLGSPRQPRLLAELPLPDATDVIVRDGYAYVAGGDDLLRVVSLGSRPMIVARLNSDPRGNLPRVDAGCTRIGMHQGWAYVSRCQTGELFLVEVASPVLLRRADRIRSPQGLGPFAADMQDGRLVLALGDSEPWRRRPEDRDPALEGGLASFEVTGAGEARAIGHYAPFYGGGWKMAVSGTDRLLVDTPWSHDVAMQIIDVAQPELPKHRTRIEFEGILSLAAEPSGRYTVVASWDVDGRVVGHLLHLNGWPRQDVDMVELPQSAQGPSRAGAEVGSHDVLVEILGDRIYWLDHWNEGDRYGLVQLRIFDASDPEAPRELQVRSFEGMSLYPNDLEVEPGWLYLATTHGLAIVDLRGEGTPRLAARIDQWLAQHLRLAEDRIYLSSGRDDHRADLDIIDVHDPEAPQLLGSTRVIEDVSFWRPSRFAPQPVGIELAGDLLIFGLFDAGLVAYDVGDPRHPRLLRTFPLAGIRSLSIQGCLAYASGTEQGLVSIAIRRLARPVPPPSPALPRDRLTWRGFFPMIQRHNPQDYCLRRG